MSSVVTIGSVRAHGVSRLLVYCRGKREGDWPCHHEGILAIDGFADDEAQPTSSVAADALLVDVGEPILDPITMRSGPHGAVRAG